MEEMNQTQVYKLTWKCHNEIPRCNYYILIQTFKKKERKKPCEDGNSLACELVI
jgi:hypothetical protein